MAAAVAACISIKGEPAGPMMSHQTPFVPSMKMQPWLILMKLLTALPNIYSVKLSWTQPPRVQ